jgi:hypothetical protein
LTQANIAGHTRGMVPSYKPTQPTVERASTFTDELKRNPLVDGVPLDQRLYQMVDGEVGRNASTQAKIVQLETAFNRAQMRSTSLSQALWTHNAFGHGQAGYYPTTTMNAGHLPPNQAALDAFNRDVLGPVLSGSNLSDIGYGPMTGNASAGVAGNQYGKGTPGYKLRGGDSYFREGPLKTLPTAPSVTVPMKAPEAPAAPQSQITPPKGANWIVTPDNRAQLPADLGFYG